GTSAIGADGVSSTTPSLRRPEARERTSDAGSQGDCFPARCTGAPRRGLWDAYQQASLVQSCTWMLPWETGKTPNPMEDAGRVAEAEEPYERVRLIGDADADPVWGVKLCIRIIGLGDVAVHGGSVSIHLETHHVSQNLAVIRVGLVAGRRPVQRDVPRGGSV